MRSTVNSSPIMNDITALEAVAPLFATAVSFIIINTIFLILRFYTVLFLRSKRLALTWDDWLLIPAWLCTTAGAIVGLVLHHYEGEGNPPYKGHDPIDVPYRLTAVLKCIWALLLILVPAYAFTRFSILALYLRVFSSKLLRYGSWFFIVFIIAQWLAFSVASICQCTPVAYYWDRTIEGGHCFDVDRFNKSFTPVNVAADIVILCMPLPTIWKLEASKLRKLGYTIIFGLGAFALAASVVRAVVLDTNTTVIITPALSNLEIEWLIIEPSLYFITACLPAMHPLFRLLVPASARQLVEAKIAKSRHTRSPGLSGSSDVQPFARLHDDDPATRRQRSRSPGKGGTFGAAGGMPDSEIDAHAEGGKKPQIEEVPMADLRQVETGDRIIVQTEIIVSQEERIENVMGF